MLYSEENVRANIRNRAGRRVFYLKNGDALTPSARDYLTRERIEILPAQLAKPEEYRLENGATFPEKPEHMAWGTTFKLAGAISLLCLFIGICAVPAAILRNGSTKRMSTN